MTKSHKMGINDKSDLFIKNLNFKQTKNYNINVIYYYKIKK